LPRWGKAPPTQAKKILQGKSTTLAGCHHHSKHHQKKPNKTKTAQAGFSHPSRQKNCPVGVLQGTPTGKKAKQNRPGRVKAPP